MHSAETNVQKPKIATYRWAIHIGHPSTPFFNDANFDQAVYDARVEIAYNSHEMIEARMGSSSRASSSAPSRSSSLAPISGAKRRAENDGNPASGKVQRTNGRGDREDSVPLKLRLQGNKQNFKASGKEILTQH
ncbi:hypothetical protein B0H13DRAFT_2306986 [Mycena leptocephala]|nr:hypothetical protein B0H13DRAFT_2306986 [Mycena leptocephala]